MSNAYRGVWGLFFLNDLVELCAIYNNFCLVHFCRNYSSLSIIRFFYKTIMYFVSVILTVHSINQQATKVILNT